jgi:hypothetical protein
VKAKNISLRIEEHKPKLKELKDLIGFKNYLMPFHSKLNL